LTPFRDTNFCSLVNSYWRFGRAFCNHL